MKASNVNIAKPSRRPPSPEQKRLARIFREMDKGREPVQEDSVLLETIQEEIRKYRAEKRGRK